MKNNEERFEKIYQLAENHFGKQVVRSISIKYKHKFGYEAKLKFEDNSGFNNYSEIGDTIEDALKNLKKRLYLVIKRYELV